MSPEGEIYKLIHTTVSKTAPIYDSGSSLARELTDDKVNSLLVNDTELEKYILNGKSELHWHNKKISHYQLVEEILNTAYLEQVENASKFLKNWDNSLIEAIIDGLERDNPKEWQTFYIPNNRKKLIKKLVTLRYIKLNKIIRDRV